MSSAVLEFKSASETLKGSFLLWDAANVPALEEVVHLSQMFRDQYGNRYHAYVLDRPDIVRRMIAHGEWVGFLVTDQSGRVLAHAALLPNGPRCFKFARALVRPSAQGFGLHSFLTRMRFSYLEELAAAERVSVSSTDAVTSHAGTQKVFEDRNFFPVGAYFSKLSDYFGSGHRESVIRYQYLFDPVVRTERSLFAPKEYWPLIEAIAERSGCIRRLYESSRPADKADQGFFKLDAQDFGTMQSLYYGMDAEASCLPILNNLEQQKVRGVQFVSVAVQLCHASACEQIRVLRSQGFYFGGVEFLPYGDALVMQWSPEFSRAQVQKWAKLQPSADSLVSDILRVEASSSF